MPLKTSKLCQSFPEIVRDSSSMLEYFIQYMESVGALHLVQFWLAVESFKAQCHSQPQTPSLGENVRHLNSDSVCSGSPLLTSCSTETMCDATGSHMGCSRTSQAAPSPGEVDRGARNVGESGARRKALQRRDTENQKYCDCGIGLHTPPLTPKQDSRADLASSPPLEHNSVNDRPLSKDSGHASPRMNKGYASPRLNRNSGYASPRLKWPTDVLAAVDLTPAGVLASIDLPPDVSGSKSLRPKKLPIALKDLPLASNDVSPASKDLTTPTSKGLTSASKELTVDQLTLKDRVPNHVRSEPHLS